MSTTPPTVLLPSALTELPLSSALARLKLERKEPGTDITHGTSFYKPVVTLLADSLGTRRQDVVYSVWPILGCPFTEYEQCLPDSFRDALTRRVPRHTPARLWEIVDLLQASKIQNGKGSTTWQWDMRGIVEWVKAVETVVARKPHVLVSLQAQADAVRERHDREGGLKKAAAGLSEGIVIDVMGPGRVN